MPLLAPESPAPATSRTTDVFTPASIALRNAVDRPALIRQVRSAASVAGRQILLYGRSQSGKSTLLFRELAASGTREVTVRCTPGCDLTLLLQSARVQAGLPPVDTAALVHRTAVDLGQLSTWLVIEDVHLLPPEQRVQAIAAAKVFSDLGARFRDLKLVLVAAVDDLDLLDTTSPGSAEYMSRIQEVYVPAMTEEELAAVVETGARMLGVSAGPAPALIAQLSGGLPAVAHQLALDAFEDAADRGVEVDLPAVRSAAAAGLRSMPTSYRRRFEAAGEYGQDRELSQALDVLATFGADGAPMLDVIGATGAVSASHRERFRSEIESLATPQRGELLELGPHTIVRFADLRTYSYYLMAAWLFQEGSG